MTTWPRRSTPLPRWSGERDVRTAREPTIQQAVRSRRDRAAQGPFDLVVTPESAGWGYSSLRVLTLGPGASAEFGTGPDEMIVLPLSGGVEVSIGSTSYRLSGRDSVFSAVTDTAYLPIDSQVRLTSEGGATIALPGARADRTPAVPVSAGVRGGRLATRQRLEYQAGQQLRHGQRDGVRQAAGDGGASRRRPTGRPTRRTSTTRPTAARPSWKRSTTTGSPRPPRPPRLPLGPREPLAIRGSTAVRSGRSSCSRR